LQLKISTIQKIYLALMETSNPVFKNKNKTMALVLVNF